MARSQNSYRNPRIVLLLLSISIISINYALYAGGYPPAYIVGVFLEIGITAAYMTYTGIRIDGKDPRLFQLFAESCGFVAMIAGSISILWLMIETNPANTSDLAISKDTRFIFAVLSAEIAAVGISTKWCLAYLNFRQLKEPPKNR